ncbi:FtsZ/tubulin family protein [Thermococcus thioreducens]|uniref:Tubulin-like protein CetZ n=1 Tax=Thermococcus thioreducens TaxID=277988 RepID=A0A0Q2XMV8_9EURY|nr:cell division protein FtsZ [Thermococcus thioreducens]ASJ11642.1 cell division protein FtsZ [Thermococcus thioreducens]KQH82620.1 cell division protein FtsZ [Thermococcus thioreducens]SEW16398.1 Cell division GTPase FtsZ [Thermococcus thioreducens]
MRALIIGVGQCGTKIADLFALVDFEALAINTSKGDLDYLKHVPHERRILIGESLTGGKGVNANPILGREAMKRDLPLVMRKVGSIIGYEDIDIFFLTFGFGGGTGAGGTPVLAKALKEEYPDSLVVAIGALPLKEEGIRPTINAAITIDKLSKIADSIIAIDNNKLKEGSDDITRAYERINYTIVERIASLLALVDVPGEQTLDASDLKFVLKAFGSFATVGYAKAEANKVKSLSRLIIKSFESEGLYLEANIESALYGLVAIHGPPETLKAAEIFEALDYLTNKIRGKQIFRGFYPDPREREVEVVTLLSGIYESRSIEDIIITAKRYAQSFMEAKEEAETKKKELLSGLPDFDDVYAKGGSELKEIFPDGVGDIEGVIRKLRRGEND